MSGRPPRSSTGKTKVVELLERNKNVQVPQRASHTLSPFIPALCEGLWARTLMTVRYLPPVDVQGLEEVLCLGADVVRRGRAAPTPVEQQYGCLGQPGQPLGRSRPYCYKRRGVSLGMDDPSVAEGVAQAAKYGFMAGRVAAVVRFAVEPRLVRSVTVEHSLPP